MIKNARQLNITERRLDELLARLDRLKVKYPLKRDFAFYSESTLDQVKLMRQHISDYKTAASGSLKEVLALWDKRGTIHPTNPTDLSLGEFIALLRICRGHTQ